MSISLKRKLLSNRNYTVDDIDAIRGIAKFTAYRPLNSGEFKIIRISYSVCIFWKSFEDGVTMEELEEESE